MTQLLTTPRGMLGTALIAFSVLACGTEDSGPKAQQNGIEAGSVAAPPVAGAAPVTPPANPGVAGMTAGSAGSTPSAGDPAGAGGNGMTVAGASAGGNSGANAAGASGMAGSANAGSGGSDDAGSGGSAGSSGSGGMAGSAGSSGSGGMAGSAGSSGSGGTGGSGTMIGNGGVVNATIIVRSGMTFDGGNKRYTAGPALGDGSQSESQQPVFRVEDGGKLINVVLGAPAADGVHCYGDATLQNIVWEDIGEDAMTIKESGTVVLDGGEARNGDDKVFQINAASTFRLSNFKASNAGKLIRQNGGTTFKVEVFIDKCDISNMDETIFRVDAGATQSRASMTNSRYSNIGDGDTTDPAKLFLNVQAGNRTFTGNTHY